MEEEKTATAIMTEIMTERIKEAHFMVHSALDDLEDGKQEKAEYLLRGLQALAHFNGISQAFCNDADRALRERKVWIANMQVTAEAISLMRYLHSEVISEPEYASFVNGAFSTSAKPAYEIYKPPSHMKVWADTLTKIIKSAKDELPEGSRVLIEEAQEGYIRFCIVFSGKETINVKIRTDDIYDVSAETLGGTAARAALHEYELFQLKDVQPFDNSEQQGEE